MRYVYDEVLQLLRIASPATSTPHSKFLESKILVSNRSAKLEQKVYRSLRVVQGKAHSSLIRLHQNFKKEGISRQTYLKI